MILAIATVAFTGAFISGICAGVYLSSAQKGWPELMVDILRVYLRLGPGAYVGNTMSGALANMGPLTTPVLQAMGW